ncbi:3'-5' exonuclease [uncultured Sunxiuqinia sp.]|uniref:3'-5' exonuclease n=1 Tax=uncultured Sunxiuqinia sp. TaxID=1573825 RepID=UPI002613F414|nr:3'-5' exonuclease [uncultured Sunxiuqinia sp.]
MFIESITKEALAELPLHAFDGKIVLVDSQEQLEKAIAYLRDQDVLGFDTETKPSFKRGQVHQVALLQLSTSDKAFIFRINKIGLPNALKDILADEQIAKVGVAIRDDIKALQKINRFTPQGFIELQDEVKGYGIQDFSLKKITGIVLGFRISKSQRLSNWEADELTEAQLSYAATDAWVACEIFNSLIAAQS